MDISNVSKASDFEREIGLNSKQADKLTYVPEVMTASDDIDLIYENISKVSLNNSIVTVGQQFSKIILVISVFFMYNFICDYFLVQEHNLHGLNLANLEGYLTESLKKFVDLIGNTGLWIISPFTI